MDVALFVTPSFMDVSIPLINKMLAKDNIRLYLYIDISSSKNKTIFDYNVDKVRYGISRVEFIDEIIDVEVGVNNELQCFFLKRKKRSTFSITNLYIQFFLFFQFIANRIDVINFTGSVHPNYYLLLFLPAKNVLFLHDPLPHRGSERSKLSINFVYKKIDKFIVYNNYSKIEFLKKHKVNKEKVACLKLGVYDIYHDSNFSNSKQYESDILFFGRITEYKGVDKLIDVIDLSLELERHYKYIIAGKPQNENGINIANKENLNIIPRYIEVSELVELFKKTKAVICPYIDATQSGVVLTAYNFNKPVIVSNKGGLPEYVINENTGIVLPNLEKETILFAIDSILEKENKLKSMENYISENIRKIFSWDDHVDRLVNIYESLIN